MQRTRRAASPACRRGQAVAYPPLEQVTRPAVGTAAAAYYLNRSPQTLRCWACYESGPIQPIRISGRLAWNTAALKRLLRAGAA